MSSSIKFGAAAYQIGKRILISVALAEIAVSAVSGARGLAIDDIVLVPAIVGAIAGVVYAGWYVRQSGLPRRAPTLG